jgi:hypothetical protein
VVHLMDLFYFWPLKLTVWLLQLSITGLHHLILKWRPCHSLQSGTCCGLLPWNIASRMSSIWSTTKWWLLTFKALHSLI